MNQITIPKNLKGMTMGCNCLLYTHILLVLGSNVEGESCQPLKEVDQHHNMHSLLPKGRFCRRHLLLPNRSQRDVLHWYSERDNIFKVNFWLSEEEWAKVSHMYQLLEVFFKVTTTFSGMKYPTTNLYFMNVYLVHYAIIEATAGVNSCMALMLAVIREKFMKYWSDYSVFLYCAAILDPRIKFKFLGYAYSKLYYGDYALQRINLVKTTMTCLFNEYGSGVHVNQNLRTSASSSTCGLGAFSYYDQYMESTSSHEGRSELELYLAEPAKRLNENVNILNFWSKSTARYPQLARMTRDILAVHVSSVPSESTFSFSKKVITPNRNSLKPKTVEALMCLQDWYRCKLQKK